MHNQIFDTADGAPERSAELRLLWSLVRGKLRDRGTYVVAAIVGTLINAYGQLLVPWFRGASDPLLAFMVEFEARPGVTTFSIFIAYAFPFCVGIYSAVAARYRLRRIESVAEFPDRKPDPVFRATKSGRLVEVAPGHSNCSNAIRSTGRRRSWATRSGRRLSDRAVSSLAPGSTSHRRMRTTS